MKNLGSAVFGEIGVELAAATRLEANVGLADWSLLLRVR